MKIAESETCDKGIVMMSALLHDADRLDAMGAIGIARAFAYGGSYGRKLYDPEIPIVNEMDEKKYLKSEGTTINHFYEKQLLLKDMLNTDTARRIAVRREVIGYNPLPEGRLPPNFVVPK